MLTLTRQSVPESFDFALGGSKSYSNRSLLIAALSDGSSVLYNLSDSEDTSAMMQGLESFGVQFEWVGKDCRVTPPTDGLHGFAGTIDVGPAGTSMRFLTALSAGVPGSNVRLQGSKRMHERPIAVLVEALCAMGATIQYDGLDGCPPLQVAGVRLAGGSVQLAGHLSSQYFSALLLIAPLLGEGLTIEVVGEQTSRSYIDMTIASMKASGITVINDNYQRYHLPAKSRYVARDAVVEGDASGASYLWGVAALGATRVSLQNISAESLQGDVRFASLLEQMGCEVSYDNNGISVSNPAGVLRAIQADMELLPDTAQTLAVLAAFAEGVTTLTGLHTLRIKETDRIAALQTELKKMNIRTESTADSLTIFGGVPHSARIATYDDHRMAMSFAIAASRLDGMQIEDPKVVGKSFPSFWQVLDSLGIAAQ